MLRLLYLDIKVIILRLHNELAQANKERKRDERERERGDREEENLICFNIFCTIGNPHDCNLIP